MASKAALATMCFYLADEVKAQNVAVNLILPGHTRTTGSDEQTRLRAAMGAANAPKRLVAWQSSIDRLSEVSSPSHH